MQISVFSGVMQISNSRSAILVYFKTSEDTGSEYYPFASTEPSPDSHIVEGVAAPIFQALLSDSQFRLQSTDGKAGSYIRPSILILHHPIRE